MQLRPHGERLAESILGTAWLNFTVNQQGSWSFVCRFCHRAHHWLDWCNPCEFYSLSSSSMNMSKFGWGYWCSTFWGAPYMATKKKPIPIGRSMACFPLSSETHSPYETRLIKKRFCSNSYMRKFLAFATGIISPALRCCYSSHLCFVFFFVHCPGWHGSPSGVMAADASPMTSYRCAMRYFRCLYQQPW